MPVYQCTQCDYRVWYAATPTGEAASCARCGAAMRYAQEDPLESPNKKINEAVFEDPNRDKSMLILGTGAPAFLLFISLVFGLIRQRITWGMAPLPGDPGFGEGPNWVTFQGLEAVLLGVSGLLLALSLHLSNFWYMATGKRYFNYMGTALFVCFLGFLVAAFVVKGMAYE